VVVAKDKPSKKAAQKKTLTKPVRAKVSVSPKKAGSPSTNGVTGKRPAPAAAPKAKVAAKPVRSGKPTAANGRRSDERAPIELRKTYLTAAELEEFRGLLTEKRRELMGDMSTLRNEAMGHGSSGENSGASSMPIHMADLGSDTWEQELTLGLIENERGLLREIDEALDRIDNRTYGICLATNKPISKSRLRAKPWAKYCIEYARQLELGR
jgi:DnaK suppressor protein